MGISFTIRVHNYLIWFRIWIANLNNLIELRCFKLLVLNLNLENIS